MKKLLIGAIVALASLTATAAPSLADGVYFQFGSPGYHDGYYGDYPRYRPAYRRYYEPEYPRYYREQYPRHKASCRTQNKRYYSEHANRWVTRSTRVCYR
ncbi:hypothetical protein A6U87_03310 [Rhizobium sp. AC44/96]|uniref:hypothetical protein n=1 Tax=Rhizobium sp. AC44/96 TaxID=1841654 RepID=UPI0008100B79|nr:hypothetical protein [Rhizobium sp. AC44/96]OCJ17960.1 hypothetical protein A6U87_03310 [Rhizobium sp. AC44/96]